MRGSEAKLVKELVRFPKAMAVHRKKSVSSDSLEETIVGSENKLKEE